MKFDNDKPGLTISKAELEALVLCASDDESRVNLHAIHIEPARRSVVSTNGMMMLIGTEHGTAETDLGATPGGGHGYRYSDCSLPPAPGDAVNVPLKRVATWLRLAGKADDLTISWADGKVSVTIDDQTLSGPTSTATFPPWRAVLAHPPTEKKAVAPQIGLFSQITIEALTALQKVSQHAKRTPVVWSFTDHVLGEEWRRENNPVMLTTAGESAHWRIVLMPMRFDSCDHSIDPFNTAFPEPQQPEPAPTPETPSDPPVAKKPARRVQPKPKRRAGKPRVQKPAKKSKRKGDRR